MKKQFKKREKDTPSNNIRTITKPKNKPKASDRKPYQGTVR